MNGYLQRLFDRGAGFAAAAPSAPSGDVTPAMASASPAVGFDQRLADPGLAQAFGILGVSPDPELLAGSEPLDETAAPPVVPRTSGTPAEPIAAPSPVRTAGRAVPPTVLPRGSVASVPEDERTGRHAMHASPSPARAEGVEPLALQPEPRAPAVEPHPVPSPPPAIETRESGPPPRAQAADAASAIATSRHQAEPAPLAFPPPPHDKREPVPPSDTVARATSLAPTLPPERLPARSPMREVEPLRRAPAPLEPPPAAAADAREVERIVRETVRAELAHRPAVGRGTGQQHGAAPVTDRDVVHKPAPRPASAHEASVIGELEPSSSPLTIYGLRRR